MMKRVGSVFIVFQFTVFFFLSGFSFDTDFYTAEMQYHNKEYNSALAVYQKICAEGSSGNKHYQNALERIITILDIKKDQPDKLKKNCEVFLRKFPEDEFSKTVAKIMKGFTEKKTASSDPDRKFIFTAEEFKKLDSMVNRFQEGFWVKYRIENLQDLELSGDYDTVTFAVQKSDVLGARASIKLLVLFEGPFKKIQQVFTTIFKEVDDYYIKEVQLKIPGERTVLLDRNEYHQKLPFSAASYEKLMEDCQKGESGVLEIKDKKVQFVRFNYNIDPGNKGYVIYSPQVPITAFIENKGKNPATYTDFSFKLIDYGYSGGQLLGK